MSKNHVSLTIVVNNKGMRKLRLLKTYLILVLSLAISSVLYTRTFAEDKNRLRIAIASFQDSTGSTRGEYSNLIADRLFEDLYEKGYDVIENDRLRAMLGKKGISWSDFIDNPYTAIGMLEGVDLIIFGDYSEPHFGTFRVSARYIDPETGDIKGTLKYIERKKSNFEDDVLPKFADYLQKDLDKLNLD